MTFSTQPSPLFMTALILILLANTILGRNIVTSAHSNHNHIEEKGGRTSDKVIPLGNEKKVRRMGRRANTVQVAGSSLPDCSHACGSCSPCRLVMVSFICEEEAESCPMAYKCMCNRKSYPVP